MEKELRYRINIKETAKHDKYWDCTVDGKGYTDDEILEKSNTLVAKLEKQYPVKVD